MSGRGGALSPARDRSTLPPVIRWLLVCSLLFLGGCDLCWPRGGGLGTCIEPDDDDATGDDDDSGDDDSALEDPDPGCEGACRGGGLRFGLLFLLPLGFLRRR